MGSESIKMRKEACDLLERYTSNKSGYILIHYARQNCFEEVYEKGPRIIAIVVMNAGSEQMLAFSLKKSADKLGYNFFEEDEGKKNEIELDMLESFYKYVEQNKDKIWLHWNMKNNNFGFYAINDRFKDLGGSPFEFDESKLINISNILRNKYGTNFARDCVWNGEVMGKMYDVFTLNKIVDTNILDGKAEIKEYILKNILSVEQSVLGKIKAFKIIIEKAADNVLITRGNILKDIYGVGISGFARYIQDNAVLAILSSIFGGIIANFICKVLGI